MYMGMCMDILRSAVDSDSGWRNPSRYSRGTPINVAYELGSYASHRVSVVPDPDATTGNTARLTPYV